nr:ATP-binding protein [Halovenus rubra]
MGIASIGLHCWLSIYAVQRRDRPGALPLTLLGAALTAASLILTLDIVANLSVLNFFGQALVFATVLWTAFTLEYTGRGPAMTRNRLIGLLGLSTVIVVLQVLIIYVFSPGFPYWLFISASNITVISTGGFGIFLVVRSGVTYDDLPLVRALVVAGTGVSIVFIWIAGIILGERLQFDSVFRTVITVLLVSSGGLFALAQYRYDLLEADPSAGHLARNTIFDEMAEAVIVSDRQQQLLDSNRTAEQVFDIGPAVLGEPIVDVIGTSLAPYDGETITIPGRDGRREYEVRQSPVKGSTEKSVGTVYMLRDVTDQQTHEQQLAVLNRVLRHNLRNDFDSIRGFAEPIRDGNTTVDETVAFSKRIRDSAHRIRDLGQKVSHAERLLEWEPLDRNQIDLVAVSESVADQMESKYPDSSVDVSVLKRPLQARTDRETITAVIEELVDNSLKHRQEAGGKVNIELGKANGEIAIVIRDDGPGIPEHERAVLLDGEETPLRHGTGIGLWFVYWGIRRLGGTLSFAENKPQGSVVTVQLPTVD